jgi:hypothetical protein
MLNRFAVLFVAGAAIFALDASAASAQDTTRTRPRSSKRIPIAKEAPGEVAPRVDTVTVFKIDTLTMQRVDTVRLTRTQTVTRVDTVMKLVLPPRLRQIGGLYIGLAGGSSMPAASFNDSDKPGWRVEVPIGIDPIGSWLGARFNFGYSQYSSHSFTPLSLDLNNADVMNFDGDLKLNLIKRTPYNARVQVYAVGGGTYTRFKNILENNHGNLSIGHTILVNGVLFNNDNGVVTRTTNLDDGWHSGWGGQIGGGLQFGWGPTNVYVESRFARFQGENTRISHVPLVLGLSWFLGGSSSRHQTTPGC